MKYDLNNYVIGILILQINVVSSINNHDFI